MKRQHPYTYFGNKRLVADTIWTALGDVPNYIEPFVGSMAIPLARPTPPRREVVNDIDGYVVNFWRAVQADPLAVWKHASSMVAELDMHARHAWLLKQHPALVEQLRSDPHFYDAKVAGWWVWGINLKIGSGWCDPSKNPGREIPKARPSGIHSFTVEDVVALASRIRRMQVICGHWRRVLTPAYSTQNGTCGVVLDPPYVDGDTVYANNDRSISAEVEAWCREHGDDPKFRIVLCGYEGEHKLPKRWRVIEWKAQGGYANRNSENQNRHRERLWLSPHCQEVPA